MPVAISLAMSAATSGREISKLGCNAGFLSARIAFLSFIRSVFGLSAAEAALYAAKRALRFLRHFMTASPPVKMPRAGRRYPGDRLRGRVAAGTPINRIPSGSLCELAHKEKNSAGESRKDQASSPDPKPISTGQSTAGWERAGAAIDKNQGPQWGQAETRAPHPERLTTVAPALSMVATTPTAASGAKRRSVRIGCGLSKPAPACDSRLPSPHRSARGRSGGRRCSA